MTYLIPVIFAITYLVFGKELGYHSESPLWTHFTYQFQHIGWAHIVVNSFALISFVRILKLAFPIYAILLFAYTGSVLASFPVFYDIPTVGASGAIYTLSGLFISTSLMKRRLKVKDWKKFYAFLACLALSFVFAWIKGGINIYCHALGLMYGMLIGIADGLCVMLKRS